MAIGFVPRLHT